MIVETVDLRRQEALEIRVRKSGEHGYCAMVVTDEARSEMGEAEAIAALAARCLYALIHDELAPAPVEDTPVEVGE